MADSKISDLTAATDLAADDVLEMVDVSATANEKIRLDQLMAWSGGYFARIASARTLTSTTSAQALFDAANDTITLPLGTYFFDALLSLSSMSGTTGNFQFQLLGGGTAVLADQLYHAVGIDGNTATAATQTGSTTAANNSAASIVTAGTGTAAQVNIKGTFEVTTAGTLIPSIALVTAAAAVLAAGSYIRIQYAGANNVQSQGPWS